MHSLMEWVAGNPAKLPLRHLILNLMVFLGLLTGAYFGVSDIVVGLDPIHKIFDLFLITIFSLFYWISRIRGHFTAIAHLTTILGLLLVGGNFLINAGIHGPTNMVFLFVLACVTLLHNSRTSLIYLIFGLLVAVACFSIQYWKPEWIVSYSSPSAEFWDISMTFLFCFFAVYAVMRIILAFFQQILEQTRLAQASALQSEKMASLGEMLAGMNHEINTPVGVIGSSLSIADHWWRGELPRFASVLRGLSAEQTDAFWSFLVHGSLAEVVPSDSKSRRSRRAVLAEPLSFLPGDEASQWAEEWESLGVAGWKPEWRPLLDDEAGKTAFRFAHTLLAHHRSMRNASLAYDKLRTLVKALGSYSRSESPEVAPQPVRLQEGLEIALTLYGASHHSVEVVRDFQNVSPVLARPDELIQVWANLIQNALQAMRHQGVLTVVLEESGGRAVVKFTDSGPGVDPDLRDRIFEPFFTTKERGQGTGLGLGIVSRIVAAHGGSVAVHEPPGGGACFSVSLPLAQETARA